MVTRNEFMKKVFKCDGLYITAKMNYVHWQQMTIKLTIDECVCIRVRANRHFVILLILSDALQR